ncbi:MAG: beta-N-acetylglucosaminidase, partial [Chitinophagaceae bacterium]
PLIFSKSWSSENASLAAQLVFGGLEIDNKSVSFSGKAMRKIKTYPVRKIRIGYSVPGSVMIDPGLTRSIDSVVNAGIATHSTPGAVILLVKDGQVIFDKAYGNHRYAGNEQTKITDIFDMASVTKVTATTPVIMQLADRKELALDSSISSYVHILKSIPDKREQTIREALLHEAGFTPYIKFYEKVTPLDLAYHRSDSFPTEIAENFFLRKNYFQEVMWPVTLASPVLTRGQFVYSDVSMYMLKQVAENISHRPLDEYVLNEFYRPLGMQFTGFRPLQRFPKSSIVPTTENDNWLRNMQVRGFVNDPGAAMSGGVQGHAGLFSTSNDLAIYYQMLLNKGTYGGKKFFDSATVSLFTSRQSKVSTRGLGFQKPVDSIPSATGFPSPESYGHSGYTGTYVWVDPAYNLIYICLTNRVYPDDGKTYGPAAVNIRARVFDLFYRAVVAGQR